MASTGSGGECRDRGRERALPARPDRSLGRAAGRAAHHHFGRAREILDTGGGIAKALPLLGEKPFFVINSDSFWVDEGEPALDRLRAAWDDEAMDCLLLLSALKQTVGYDGHGRFRARCGGPARAAFGSRESRSSTAGPISFRRACSRERRKASSP
jgi:hypothetical protein